MVKKPLQNIIWYTYLIVILAAKAVLLGKRVKKEDQDAFLLEMKLKLARELLSRAMPKNKIRAIMNFLRYYVRFSDPKNNSIFDQELTNITKKTTTMGIEELLLDRAKKEGIKEGRHEEAIEIACKLKKEGLSIEFIAKTTGLTIKEIESL